MCCAVAFHPLSSPVPEGCLGLGYRAIRSFGGIIQTAVRAELESSAGFVPLSEQQKLQVTNALEKLENHQSLGQRLHIFLGEWQSTNGELKVPDDIATHLGELLQTLRNNKRQAPQFVEWKDNIPTSCNKCYMSFEKYRSEFKRNRRLVCGSCGRLHFWTGEA
jgi:protein-arginine kinase activator protein McsA